MTDAVIPSELGTEKIGKLLRNYAVPAIIAMTASSLYNMVDSIFIGRGVGALAISGLAVTFPLMNLSTAFGTLVGVGGSTMLSVLLGQKNYEASNKVLGNIVSLNMIVGFIFMAVALIWLNPILRFFGASDNTLQYAREYMQIILFGNVVTHVYYGLNAAMRSSGNPRTAMGLTLFTVVFNSILDPIMIFWMGMGIKGAAWATVISQVIALIITIFLFNRRNQSVHFEKGIVKLDWRIAKDSISIGFGPFLMNSASCIVVLLINLQMGKFFSDLGIGAYGICNRITFLFFMICMGIQQGMQPIAGYNYGARLYNRVIEVYNKAVFISTCILVFATALCVFFPELAVSLFSKDQELISLSSHGLRIMNSMAFVIGFTMLTTNLFQSIGMIEKSIFLSLIRQLLYLIPLLYVLPLFIGGDGVWWSFPISDTMAFLTALIMRQSLIKKFRRLKDGDDASQLLGSKL